MARIPLSAKTAVSARAEIRQRWPKQDVNYYGYASNGECVIMSLVRGVTKGNVATAVRNRSPKATRFEAEVLE